MAQARALTKEQIDLASFLHHSDEFKEMTRLAKVAQTAAKQEVFQTKIVSALNSATCFADFLEKMYDFHIFKQSKGEQALTLFGSYLLNEAAFAYYAQQLRSNAEKLATICGYAKAFAWPSQIYRNGDNYSITLQIPGELKFDLEHCSHLKIDGVMCKITELSMDIYADGKSYCAFSLSPTGEALKHKIPPNLNGITHSIVTISTTGEALKQTILANPVCQRKIPLDHLSGDVLLEPTQTSPSMSRC